MTFILCSLTVFVCERLKKLKPLIFAIFKWISRLKTNPDPTNPPSRNLYKQWIVNFNSMKNLHKLEILNNYFTSLVYQKTI